MQEIDTLLADNFAAGVMTGADRKLLKAAIRARRLNKNQLAWLRSRIFDLGKQGIKVKEPEMVLAWLEDANKLLLPDEENNEPYDLVTFSPGTDGKNLIKSQLASATRSLDICVFTISDNDISTVIASAHRRGIKVRVITDDQKRFDAGSDIDMLVRWGVPVRMDTSEQHMHHKFAIIDGKRLLTGSYNWTRTAAERNYENLLVTSDLGLVEPFVEEFEKLWHLWAVASS